MINFVTVTASSPGNTNDVNDVSDDGNDSDGNSLNDPTITLFNSSTEIEVTKTSSVTDNNSNSVNDLGDTIFYTITVENKSNVSLTGLVISDVLTDGNGNVLSLSTGPTFISSSASSSQGTLAVGETAVYSAGYVVTQAALDSGSVSNVVTATASSPGNTNDVIAVSYTHLTLPTKRIV